MKYIYILISALIISGCKSPEPDHDKLAQTAQFKKKYELATTHWSSALAKGASYDRHLSRGDCYRLSGKYEMAANDYSQAMALRPEKNDTARLARMKVLLQAGNTTSALEDADFFIEANRSVDSALAIKAACQYQSGNFTECVISSENLIKRGIETDHDLHYNLAMSYLKIYKKDRQPKDYKTKARTSYETFFKKKTAAGFVMTSDDWYYRGVMAWINVDLDSRNAHWKNLPADYLKKKNIDKNDL